MTHTETRAGLLRAIVESPENTALRLVYADWLADNGEPEREEFIRVQCELAERFPGLNHESLPIHTAHLGPMAWYEFDALRRRERELLFPEGKFRPHQEWFPEFGVDWLFKRSGYTDNHPDKKMALVRRGFVERVRCPLSAWFGQKADGSDGCGPQIVACQPVTGVEITGLEADGEVIQCRMSNDHWSRLDSDCTRTLTCHIPRLLWLLLSASAIGDCKEYDGDATEDLNRVCLAWARSVAELPDLGEK